MSVECAIDRDEQEMLEAIRRTMEETSCPEGLDVCKIVKKSNEDYWDRRMQEAAAYKPGPFVRLLAGFKRYLNSF